MVRRVDNISRQLKFRIVVTLKEDASSGVEILGGDYIIHTLNHNVSYSVWVLRVAGRCVPGQF